MKARLYTGDMHLNSKDENMYEEKKNNNDFLGNKTVKTFFLLVQMFSTPLCYLASIMFRIPRQYF